ncbi:LapA family protein [Desertimonas flava]|jgi:uncharacterized integral membrane protein|uniref:LapA family protein n=1 Tax=Desertimonas flava TaxID=2064846 RepID=UPI000E34A3DF|nr:LapA family protein [Desertimonas flava]
MSDTSSSGGGLTITPKMVIIAVLAVLAVVFVFQNTDSAKLKVIFFTITMPRWIAFVILLVIGAIIGYVGRGVRAKRAAG